MELKQRQYSVLIVSAQPKFNETLKTLFTERQYDTHEFEGSVTSAKRRLLERDYDIVMINAPLPDDSGVRLAIDRSSGSSSAVLLLVRAENYAEIFEQVCPYGVYTLAKPSPRQLVTQAFDWLETTCERMGRLRSKTSTLEEKMAEIRLVNRAKWKLISEKGMTEEQAHRTIEKLAMDSCVSKRTIAEQIIAS